MSNKNDPAILNPFDWPFYAQHLTFKDNDLSYDNVKLHF